MSISPVRASGIDRPAPQSDDARLRDVARQLEGAFVEQLFKAMRDSVPEGGLVDGGSGEEMFAGMMDQHLAAQVPAEWNHGLGATLYRQLRAAASLPEVPAADPPKVSGPEI